MKQKLTINTTSRLIPGYQPANQKTPWTHVTELELTPRSVENVASHNADKIGRRSTVGLHVVILHV